MRARNPSSARDTYRERPEAFRRERDDGVPSWTPRSWGGGSQRSQRSGGGDGGGGPEGGRGWWEAFKARFWRSNGGDAAPRAPPPRPRDAREERYRAERNQRVGRLRRALSDNGGSSGRAASSLSSSRPPPPAFEFEFDDIEEGFERDDGVEMRETAAAAARTRARHERMGAPARARGEPRPVAAAAVPPSSRRARAEAERAPPLRHPLEQWSLRQQHELKKRGYADEDFSPYRYTPEGRGHAQN